MELIGNKYILFYTFLYFQYMLVKEKMLLIELCISICEILYVKGAV